MAAALKRKSSAAIGTTATSVGGYVAPSVTTGVVVTGLTCTNILNTTITITVYVTDGVTQWNIVKNAVVLAGGNLTLADEGTRQVLNSGDQIFAVSSNAASLDVNMSVSEIT